MREARALSLHLSSAANIQIRQVASLSPNQPSFLFLLLKGHLLPAGLWPGMVAGSVTKRWGPSKTQAHSSRLSFDDMGLCCLHLSRNGSQKIRDRCTDQTSSRVAQTSGCAWDPRSQGTEQVRNLRRWPWHLLPATHPTVRSDQFRPRVLNGQMSSPGHKVERPSLSLKCGETRN